VTRRVRVVAVVSLVAAAGMGVVAGAAGVVMREAPVTACGGTPGFCPNPPDEPSAPVSGPAHSGDSGDILAGGR
jgi:hypothetical protein